MVLNWFVRGYVIAFSLRSEASCVKVRSLKLEANKLDVFLERMPKTPTTRGIRVSRITRANLDKVIQKRPHDGGPTVRSTN